MDEQQRQDVISRYSLGGPDREPVFDNITKLASDIFDVPIALVTVLALERQLFRGACGLEGGTPRDVAFCDHTIRQRNVMVVPDALKDPRFAQNPLVTGEPHIRFYAGAPIRIANDIAIGSLCLIDRVAREFDDQQQIRLGMMAATVRDVIELRAGSLAATDREAALTKQSDLLQGTVEHIEQGIAVFSPELRLILWNNRFFELFGLPINLASPATEASALLRIVAARGELGPGAIEDVVGSLLHSSRTLPQRRLEITRIDGTVLDICRSRMSDGNLILAASDITHARHLERTKDEFISTVNHELRTPLTAILGSLALIQSGRMGPLSERTGQLLRVARQNGQRLNALINDLLDIEKISAGGLKMREDAVELTSLVERAVEQNKPYAERLDVQLKVKVPNEEVWIRGDTDRLLQTFANLLSNAAKFSPQGAIVTTALTRNDSTACIAVEDRGAGIAVEFRGEIFGRFAQANPADARTRGTGLGLAISKEIIEKHGGSISFESEVGAGTTFFVDLPLMETPHVQAT